MLFFPVLGVFCSRPWCPSIVIVIHILRSIAFIIFRFQSGFIVPFLLPIPLSLYLYYLFHPFLHSGLSKFFVLWISFGGRVLRCSFNSVKSKYVSSLSSPSFKKHVRSLLSISISLFSMYWHFIWIHLGLGTFSTNLHKCVEQIVPTEICSIRVDVYCFTQETTSKLKNCRPIQSLLMY